MPGANPNLGMVPGRISNVQQAAYDKAAEQRTRELKNPPKPTEAPKPAEATRKTGPNTSSEIVDKTPIQLPEVVITAKRESSSISGLPVPNTQFNVLNSYRSYSYKFTFAGLDSKALETPTLDVFRQSSEKLIILKSSGKGSTVMSATESSDDIAQGMIKDFNSNSPGRFDLYIENVQVDTTMAFEEQTNLTLPTKISFEVYEPYSINGFIEALQVAAVGAGYPSYTVASFILKMEFVGYPDTGSNNGLPPPVVEIPGTVRYFVIQLTGMEIELTERGTRYRCGAIPINEIGFANLDNKLAQSIQVQGSTVGSILNNFMKELQDQRAQSAAESKQSVTGFDTYSIVFPSWVEGKGFDEAVPNRTLVDSEFAVNLKDNKTFAFGDLTDTTKSNAYRIDKNIANAAESSSESAYFARLSPDGNSVVSFSTQVNIDDCITAVISDSNYTRNLLKTVKEKVDAYGMVDYFLIKLEITNQNKKNDQTKMPYRNFKYVVTPYKIHYTTLPMYSDHSFDPAIYSKRAVREYNYYYTGKNVDVLSFKLNFNTLYFEAIGNALGNNDKPPDQTAGSNDNAVQPATATKDIDAFKKSSIPSAGQRVLQQLTEDSSRGKAVAGPQQDDPYWLMSRAMHNAVINSKTSMLTGELEIIGDPFYLATGGIGNYKPQSSGVSTNQDGTVDKDYGQVLILINFKNPADVRPLNASGEGGMLVYVPHQAAFSGIYKVLTVTSTFSNGVFKQRLSVMRMPQSDDTGTEPTPKQTISSAPGVVTTPDPTAQIAEDANKDATQAPVLTPTSYTTTIQNLASALNQATPGSAAYQSIQGQIQTVATQYANAQSASPLTKLVNKP